MRRINFGSESGRIWSGFGAALLAVGVALLGLAIFAGDTPVRDVSRAEAVGGITATFNGNDASGTWDNSTGGNCLDSKGAHRWTIGINWDGGLSSSLGEQTDFANQDSILPAPCDLANSNDAAPDWSFSDFSGTINGPCATLYHSPNDNTQGQDIAATTCTGAPAPLNFTVTKQFSDNSSTATATVSLTCGALTVTPPASTTLNDNGNAVFSVAGAVDATSCTATESGVTPGYTQAESCTATFVSGAACTITNTLVSQNFTVTKQFSDNSSTATATVSLTCGALTVTPPASTTLNDNGNAVFSVAGAVDATSCTATESGVTPGYTQAESCTATFVSGAACTITNTLVSQNFTVTKQFSDNSSTATATVSLTCGALTVTPPASTTLNDNGNAVFSVAGAVDATSCTATESGVTPGYTQAESCTATFVSGAACTITNTLVSQNFTVTKQFSDNSSTATATVSLTCGALTVTPPASTTLNDNGNAVFSVAGAVDATSCTATESGVTPGYTQAESCTATFVSGAACTITNTLVSQNFTVTKQFSDNSSTATATVSLTCGALTVTPPASTTLNDNGNAVFSVAGAVDATSCTATESGVTPGYTQAESCTATFVSGAACTITNTLVSQNFTVTKQFSDNSSTATATVSLTCGALTVTPPASTTLNDNGNAVFSVAGAVDATSCTATESGVTPGYTQAESCTATFVSGAACTITNTLNSASFTVIKDFQPNNATQSVTVTLDCGGAGTIVGDNPQTFLEGGSASWTVTGLASSASCTATESPVPDNYDANQAGCASQSLGVNGSVTCTIVNELHGQVTVQKVCAPDTTLDLTQDFSFDIDSGTASAGDVIDCGQTTDPIFLPEGQYTVSESLGDSQYELTSIDCDPETSGNQDSLTVEDQHTYTCVITNAPFGQITVVKTCDPATNNADDFDTSLSGVIGDSIECGGAGAVFTVPAGNYTVGEAPESGNVYQYLASSFSGACDANGGVTVAAGQAYTCSIANSAIGSISALKSCGDGLVESQTADATFTFNLYNGETLVDTITGIACGDTVTFVGVPALNQGAYHVVESLDGAPDGWDTVDNGCDEVNASLDPEACTIENGLADPAVGKVPDLVKDGDGIYSVEHGAQFDYTVRVVNQGNLASPVILLEDYGLTGATIVSVTPDTDCTVVAGSAGFECQVSGLGAGGFVDFTVTVQANDTCQPINNNARVSFLQVVESNVSALVVAPTVFADDVQSDQVTVTGCTTDLRLSKAQRRVGSGGFTTSSVNVGTDSVVEYRIVVRNSGNQPLTGVTFSDAIPSGLTLNSIETDPDNHCDIVGGDLSCETFDLDPGESYTLVIRATVDSCSGLLNRARGDSDQTASETSNAVQLVNNSDECSGETPQTPETPTPAPSSTPTSEVQGSVSQPQQPPRISEVLPTRLPATGTGSTASDGQSFGFLLWGALAGLILLGCLGVGRAVSRRR